MYAKIFAQIFDSSIAEDWQVRHVFEDLLKLCDRDGIVDRTPEAIARRTNVPLKVVARAIAILEQPDARSRNQEYEGRRIVRLSGHRDWGWHIVNYGHYRDIASEEQRREKNLEAVRRYRAKKKAATPVAGSCRPSCATGQAEAGTENSPTPARVEVPKLSLPVPGRCKAQPTAALGNHPRLAALDATAAGDGRAPMPMQKPEAEVKRSGPLPEKDRPPGREPLAGPNEPAKPVRLTGPQKELAVLMECFLGNQWVNDAGKWIGRIRTQFGKSERVIMEVGNAVKENRILTTPAQYAEDTWRRFAA